jgi:hypothetical protein
MCGEVRPRHSSPDTDVHCVLTNAGEATAMGARGNPRHMVRGNRVRPLFRADYSQLWTRPEISHGVRLVGSRELRGPARPDTVNISSRSML